ncbi:MAG TPA: PD-(D/E)XK nuclease family protein [Bryobacteraceae bacterium]|nr:PD-(D/E)XK nuclease family protein [Bryobacteraceae bacterium]
MLLLTGPAGSGKSWRVAERFREFLRRNDTSVRLLVPTATLARHLQNRFAREGFVFRPGLIQTLSRFVDTFAADLPQVSEPAFYLIVEETALRLNRPEFAGVVRLPGFCASLARAMAEFSSAGCDAARLAAHLPETPLGPAFLAIYEEVDRELVRRGLSMRATRLEHVAGRIARDGMPGISTVLLDGFHALPDPELAVIRAMGQHADLTLTLPPGARHPGEGFTAEPCGRTRTAAPVEVTAAPTLEREADEIARRILEQAGQGRRFREMAVVVRTQDVYESVLRASFERFGIPARFYFDANLAGHPVAQYLAGAVDAMLGGWDWAATMAVLRLTESGYSSAVDRLDFTVRERIPAAGLAGLREIAGDGRIARIVDALGTLDELRALSLAPGDWSRRLRCLRALYQPPRAVDGVSHETARMWRSHAAVLNAFDEALDQVGEALAPAGAPIAFADFWRAFRSVLRLTPLRLDDDRRDTVHVLGAHEARQWQVPVVFVCGLVEKQFPRLHRQCPFFPDPARRALARAGIRVRTAAEFEAEERALFDAAVSRATVLTVLSSPSSNAKGEQNLRSLFLDGVNAAAHEPLPVRPAPRFVRAGWRPPVALRDPELLRFIAERTAVLSPTALEAYLHCPYRFFGDHLLRLKPPPPRPEERFDFLAQGNIVHEVLAEWHRRPQPVEPLFERIFRRTCGELNILPGYQTESLRLRMLADVTAFVASDPCPRGEETRTEQPFEYVLGDGLSVRGRIDRLEILSGSRGFVIDYKYSGPQRIKERAEDANSLQPPLYLLAVERAFELEPAGMYYCGLRGQVKSAGWDAPFEPEWLPSAIARSMDAAARIRAGEIAPRPSDGEACAWCASHDVCRFQAARVMTAESA